MENQPNNQPAQPPQQMSPAPNPAPQTQDTGKTLGIVGLIFAFLIAPVGFILSIIALIQSKKAGFKNVPAIIGICISAIWVIIVPIGVLAAITTVSFGGISTRANTAKANTNAALVQNKAEAFYADCGRYPASVSEITTNPPSCFNSEPVPTGITVIGDGGGAYGANLSTVESANLSAMNGLTTVAYGCLKTCINSTGGRISFWDFVNDSRDTTTIFVGKGGDSDASWVSLPK